MGEKGKKQALKPVGSILSNAPSSMIPASDLVQLGQANSEAVLAVERHGHARTKVLLIEATARAQLAEARADVATHWANRQAAEKRYRDLTADVMRTHNLTDKHAIDPLTGAVVLPEP